MKRLIPILFILLTTLPLFSQKDKKSDTEKKEPLYESSTYSGLAWRGVGPALASGRIADFAVNPDDRDEYYVAVACGGVWKTTNGGTTYDPIFDGQGSYSIGCVTLDPNNKNVVWVGTGENNNQRALGYGDGVYRSRDGGKSWDNMGLKNSQHIGMIAVDPRNSDVVYVAAYGPVWSEGGDRGLYKTINGGKDWEKVLDISKYTGVNEVHLDPRNPEIIYATAHQRMRKVWTYLGGGPESAIYKSTDGGKNWRKLTNGLPGNVDVGRIGLTISPVNPDILYAIVEAQEDKGGFFRSTDRGESWEKRGSYSTSGNYYQELIPDPKDENTVYSMNTFSMKTTDGGKNWSRLGNKYRHVDDHAFWIDPKDPDYCIIGCDGGVYDSHNGGEDWDFKGNLPVTQFYKVVVDNREPFYYIYGGTQDNNSQGGPSRTVSSAGIVNSDWFKTNPGDGFESAVDPENPDIIYAQSQYGWLFRYDKVSGERILIKPQEPKGEAYRWNWDAPLFISPHSHTRLYFAANKLFRSDDRGNTWKVISPDLTRQLDRNQLPIMGKVWSVDAVAKNQSTSIYGNIVALDESPVQEDLLYVGTDDGLIQVSEDAGGNWRKMATFPGVPDRTYVNYLLASQHDAGTVYAVFNNHKEGDFKPYILKSTDKGKTWTSISSNLPERGSAYTIAEDFEDPNLLFVGTDFGCYFSNDGGEHWTKLGAGLPTIAVRDIAIQKKELDVVIATFGRSFYVLDDYTALRQVNKDVLAEDAHVFTSTPSLMFIESNPYGYSGKGFQGSSFFAAPNPPVGATFTYYLKDKIKSVKDQRQEHEKELSKKEEPVPYPTFGEMRTEDDAVDPYLIFTVTDKGGNIVRRLKTNANKTGINRITWDFRYPHTAPTQLKESIPTEYYDDPDVGQLALPGTYYVSMSKVINDSLIPMTDPVAFEIRPLKNQTLFEEDREAVLAFTEKVSELRRALDGAVRFRNDLNERVQYLQAAVEKTPKADFQIQQDLRNIELQLDDLKRKLQGDYSLASREFETEPGLQDRVGLIIYGFWKSTSGPTETMKQQYDIAADMFSPVLDELATLDQSISQVESKMESLGAPYTPGRLPKWEKK